MKIVGRNPDEHATILLAASLWWPLSARLALAFLRYGIEVSAICPPGHPLRWVPGLRAIHTYRRLDSEGALRTAIDAEQPTLIVPCDDGVVWQLHHLHATVPGLRPLIERSIGPPESYPILSSRARLLDTASDIGIRIPLTTPVESEDQLAVWPFSSGVLKLDGSLSGWGIDISHSAAKRLDAYRRMSKPRILPFAIKRLLIDRDPLAFWLWRRPEPPGITLQQFIPGHPANTMLACWQGEVLSSVTVEVLCSQGAKGAATIVRVIEHEEIRAASRILAKRLNLSGFLGLDFILEDMSGPTHSRRAYLIELNPRCTQLGHLQFEGKGDLAGALLSGLQPELPETENICNDPIQSDIIAFFPQAFLLNPYNDYLRTCYHDLPWGQPELAREFMLEPWPERQFLARLYHSMHPLERPEENQHGLYSSQLTAETSDFLITKSL